MAMTPSRRRQPLPGQECPKCGFLGRAIHLRYEDKGKQFPIPIRTFECRLCSTATEPFRYKRQAIDLSVPTTVDART